MLQLLLTRVGSRKLRNFLKGSIKNTKTSPKIIASANRYWMMNVTTRFWFIVCLESSKKISKIPRKNLTTVSKLRV
jgi:hypothetical protein